MTTQTEMFPRTTMEVLESLRAVHVIDVEKAGTALENLGDDEKVARRYEKAEERLADARGLVSDIDRAIDELRAMDRAESVTPTVNRRTGKSVVQTAADIINSGAVDTHGLTVTASVTPAVTPADFTNEVAAELAAQARNRRARERDAVDPTTGEVAPTAVTIPVVVALYPGDDESHVTRIGPFTRYSELVADYFTAGGMASTVDADDWQVLAEAELTKPTGGHRPLYEVIRSCDYGMRLIVAAVEQGSVTGAEDVAEVAS